MTRSTLSNMQRDAWAYYGFAGSEFKPVGEVRYVVGWMAEQMTRLDWDVLIGGSDKWVVNDPAAAGSEKATTVGPRIATNTDGKEDLTKASTELLDLITWNDTNVKSITTNLFVAGQGDYIQDKRVDAKDDVATGEWRVISVVKKNRRDILKRSTERVPFIWAHPADDDVPDAPLFGVLRTLDKLDWLDRQEITQSKQRILVSGLLAAADGFEGPPKADGTPSTFWEQWNETMSAKMADPDDLSPLRLTGPLNLIKEGLNWIVPDFGYDDVIDRRQLAAINRLAYGLPVPPEILLGMQAQSRATAFQVEENAYRAHIEPPAWMVAQVAEDALKTILDREDVKVVPNPTRLLARRNSVQDVKDAYDRGLVTAIYLREVLGIPEDAAPELDGTPPAGSPNAAPEDPANVAADAPVTAALSDDLSALLADVDATLSSELAGATFMATDRARQRLGAAARGASTLVRSNPDLKPLTSAQLAVKLGFDGLVLAGVSIEDQIGEPIDTAARWWTTRIHQAWSQVGELVPGWAGQDEWVSTSVKELVEALATHVVDTLTVDDVVPLGADQIRTVVDAAAGGS